MPSVTFAQTATAPVRLMPACAEQTPGENAAIAAMLGALVAVPFYSRRTVLLTPRFDEPPA